LYQIVTPLGEGGMAAVYKAYQFSVDRYVALKVLPRHFADDPQFIQRFDQEAKVLAGLQHPHILPVHDYGHAESYAYIVMPLLAGGDLADLLSTRRCTLEEIGRIISQVGDALDYAHSQGIVHRDVKPSNILIDQRGNCLLSDFGLAKLLEGNSSLTGSGYMIGTPSYMSPEQGMGQTLDGRSDIYALGVILYEMVTGQVPYRAETPMAVVFKHIQDPLPPPSKIDPSIPEALERVILKSLAKKPEDRFATPGDMVKALRAAILSVTSSPQNESTSPARYSGIDEKTRRLDNSNPITNVPAASPTLVKENSGQSGVSQTMFWGVISLLLVIVIGLAVGVWWFSRSGGPAALPPAPPAQLEQPPVPGQLPPAPPPEAIEACRGAAAGAACTANTPRGAISGTCQVLPGQQQLACIPAGGPPPPGP
jgi:serine/threonine protein kinase